ncbi:3-demethylubiquinone-9 3-O-methyltransferase [Geomonas sp. Red875]|uniref:3-demethylubiquinone-9 3-O-methyltransferase n=2 Tax=Geomesophilobacter sediminis TaxID=2798584 RepID=A0A8J7LW38_9BACT|nr:3-demethylubiquinone-9 3-O-methyltransferase [Geomesophilobacter sediminis]
MAAVPQRIYERIDNGLYDDESDSWWGPDSPFFLMTTSLNPARVGYLRRVVGRALGPDLAGRRALEVGCGGGILCEEIARMGFATTGIDPAAASIAVASRHAAGAGLAIDYLRGSGERLPFADGAFDAVFCCDVLEHVRDLPAVISEIGRVLKPGGIFCYDTINRTVASWLMAIKVSQEWSQFAYLPPRLHVWEMFIKPQELRGLLAQSGITWREHRGLKPNRPLWQVLWQLYQRAQGRISMTEMGSRLGLVECDSLQLMYLGYGVKRGAMSNEP